MKNVLFWNYDKPHRCPACHTVAVDGRHVHRVLAVRCCRCGTYFSKRPGLARWLPSPGVVCSHHRSSTSLHTQITDVFLDEGER